MSLDHNYCTHTPIALRTELFLEQYAHLSNAIHLNSYLPGRI
jgi:hypothetical protein